MQGNLEKMVKGWNCLSLLPFFISFTFKWCLLAEKRWILSAFSGSQGRYRPFRASWVRRQNSKYFCTLGFHARTKSLWSHQALSFHVIAPIARNSTLSKWSRSVSLICHFDWLGWLHWNSSEELKNSRDCLNGAVFRGMRDIIWKQQREVKEWSWSLISSTQYFERSGRVISWKQQGRFWERSWPPKCSYISSDIGDYIETATLTGR